MTKLAPALFALLALALGACGTAPLDETPVAQPAALFTDADLEAAAREADGPTSAMKVREIAPAPSGPETTLKVTDEPALSTQDVLPDVSGYVVYTKTGSNPLSYIMRANQANDQKTIFYAGIEYPTSVAISGNGNKLYFTTHDTDASGKKVNRLYRYTIGSQDQLTELASGGGINNVSTSYSGDTVAWQQLMPCNATLSCMKRVIKIRTYNGSSYTTKIVSLQSAPYAPSLSGDGKKLAFLQKTGSTIKVQHLILQTGDLQQVYAGNNNVVHPSPSDNGKVGWAEGDPGKFPTRLKVKNLNTGAVTTIPFYNYGIYHAHLTADGTYMAYAGFGDNGGSVETIHVAYGEKAIVDTGGGTAGLLAAYWQK